MSLFVVDKDKCKRDGTCVMICPMRIIEMSEETRYPIPSPEAEDLCIDCGHCVSICPNGAFTLRTMFPEQLRPLRDEFRLSPKHASNFLKSRRSVRTYKNKPVEKKIIDDIIETASYAPSGHNRQPVQWLVIYDTDELKRLGGIVVDWMRYCIVNQPELAKAVHMKRVTAAWDRGNEVIFRGAPHLVVAYAHKDDPTAQVSCTIALTYLELAAFSHNLGACWAGYFQAANRLFPPMAEAMKLPEGFVTHGAMMIGQPRYPYKRIPTRKDPDVIWR